ncbi:ParA family protein [Klebsiella pneumoniae]|uniref:ParA family protein n=1 Tax=Klebsiella pneumoniae TaxID=573 RepID=UPI001E11F1D7|nr:ParA family protein [Salmonella enterica]EHI4413275.1 ParA family protein [Salmonella enterica]EHP1583899.1 ParA family protein [Salmonella enterica]
MSSIAIFNNKGGVGKSTMTYHLAYALAESGKKTLMIDLDPQSNLSLFVLDDEQIEEIWDAEEPFIEDYEKAKSDCSDIEFNQIHNAPRSIHYILKPSEDGQSEEVQLPPSIKVNNNLHLIPGRLTLHLFENKLSKQWSEAFLGEPQALRVITAIRRICKIYTEKLGFDVILIDTSPSLGILNKVIISNSDGFLIPCAPDMFSGYGIKNIGNALKTWKKDFDTMMSLLPNSKRTYLPNKFVKLIGYTIYNAKKREDASNPLKIAKAHYNWAEKLPSKILDHIPEECYAPIPKETIKQFIGGNSIIYGHATMPANAQKYKKPMWLLPSSDSIYDPQDRSTINGRRDEYLATRQVYTSFANEVLLRVEEIGK